MFAAGGRWIRCRSGEAQNLGPAFAEATGMTEEQVGEYMATEFRR